MYKIEIQRPGFADVAQPIQIRSAIPLRFAIQLRPASVRESVTVHTADAAPDQAGSVNRINVESIQTRPESIPGRSLQDLVNSQPGWLYEGNAVLHPRGSEYQTQFVVDGIPLTDNRSPSFGPEIEADDVKSHEHLRGRHSGGVRTKNGRRRRDSTPSRMHTWFAW